MKLRVTVEGRSYEVEVEVLDASNGGPAPLPAAPAPAAGSIPAPMAPPRPAPAAAAPSAAEPGDVQSPIAGSVAAVRVDVGQAVDLNDTLLVLEAMKMESNVASPIAGTVKEICVAAGDAVRAGQVLVRLG